MSFTIGRKLAMSLILLSSHVVAAAGSGITYQGRILRPDGEPLSGAHTQFKLQIRTGDGASCLMYEEVQALDLRNSNGQFSLTINDGSGSRTDTTGLTLDRIFANRGTFTLDPATCAVGTGSYSPSPADGRTLAVLFKDETMAAWEPIPPQKINFVPLAFESKQVQGFTADSLLRVVNGSGDPLTGVSPLSNAQYTELLALLNGTSSRFSQLGGVALPTMTTGEVLGWNGTAWVSQPAVAGANSVTTTMIQNAAVDSTKIAANAVGATQIAANAVDSTKIANGAVGTNQVANDVSINTSGTLGAAVTTTRDFKIYAASPSVEYVEMKAPALGAGDSYTLTWPLGAGSANQVLTTDGTGGLSWSTPAASGISALTGDVSASGTGSVAATVNGIGGSTAALVHSAEVAANGAASANTASTIVKRDGSGNFSANVATVNGLALNNSGSLVNLVNPLGAAYTLTLPPAVGASGQVLSTTGSGALVWSSPFTSSTGFVQGGNAFGAPAVLGTTDANDLKLVTNGTEKLTVLSTGNVGIGTTAPAHKLDVVGDINVTGNFKVNGTNIATGGGDFMKDGSVAMTGNLNLNGHYLSGDGDNEGIFVDSTGNVGIGTTAPAGKFEVKGYGQFTGMTAGAVAPLILLNPYPSAVADYGTGIGFRAGSNVIQGQIMSGWTTNASNADAYLALQTRGSGAVTEKVRVASNGDVGIGTTAPAYKLDVAGAVNATAFKINGVDISSGAAASNSSATAFTFNSDSDNAGGDGGFNFQHNGSNLVTINNAGNVNIASTTASSNWSSGALVVAGGLGVNGNVNANGNLNSLGASSNAYSGSGATQFPSSGPSVGTVNTTSLDSAYAHMRIGARNTNVNYQYGYIAVSSTAGAGSYSPILAFGRSTGASAYNESLRIDGDGDVGIGTTAPSGRLDVRGSIRSVASAGGSPDNATATVDWSLSNNQSMSTACTATTFNNMLDGATYNLLVTETSATTCVFSASGLTFLYAPANGSRVGGKATIYSFTRIGSNVVVSWSVLN